ncbi:hypothetical protein [Streptomyces sp.]|uniref:hypothetical protein n=1 Tax=Streptomyces sp. TaxID=1931 RepID=UPI002F93C52E
MFQESDEHHRRNRASGGSRNPAINLPSNLLLVCGTPTTGCHGWIGAWPAEAMRLGFSVSTNGNFPPSAKPVEHALYGWVLLNDEGGWTRLVDHPGTDRLLADLKTKAASGATETADETTPNPSKGTES